MMSPVMKENPKEEQGRGSWMCGVQLLWNRANEGENTDGKWRTPLPWMHCPIHVSGRLDQPGTKPYREQDINFDPWWWKKKDRHCWKENTPSEKNTSGLHGRTKSVPVRESIHQFHSSGEVGGVSHQLPELTNKSAETGIALAKSVDHPTSEGAITWMITMKSCYTPRGKEGSTSTEWPSLIFLTLRGWSGEKLPRSMPVFFLMFNNDPEWTWGTFWKQKSVSWWKEGLQKDTGYMDLYLMSRYRHNIIITTASANWGM